MNRTAKRCRLVKGSRETCLSTLNVDFGVGVKKRRSVYGVK